MSLSLSRVCAIPTLSHSFAALPLVFAHTHSHPYSQPQISTRSMATTSTKKQEPRILETETYETPARWLRLQRIKYQDQEGKERFWEVANRSTRPKGGVDSCHILAIIHAGNEKSVLLIEQYRPPVGAVVVEFPAGLMDPNEDAAGTAVRELYEETGYKDGVKVRSVSPVLVKDPGMTGATMNLVTIDIAVAPGAPEPEPHLEDGEHIVKRLVPIRELDAVLQDYAKRGFAIDALVQSVAMGLSLAA